MRAMSSSIFSRPTIPSRRIVAARVVRRPPSPEEEKRSYPEGDEIGTDLKLAGSWEGMV